MYKIYKEFKKPHIIKTQIPQFKKKDRYKPKQIILGRGHPNA